MVHILYTVRPFLSHGREESSYLYKDIRFSDKAKVPKTVQIGAIRLLWVLPGLFYLKNYQLVILTRAVSMQEQMLSNIIFWAFSGSYHTKFGELLLPSADTLLNSPTSFR